MTDFDILGSLGVVVPSEPLQSITRTSEFKVIAPHEKPPILSPTTRARDLKLDDLGSNKAKGTPTGSAGAKSPHSANLRVSVSSSGGSRVNPRSAPYVTTAQLANMSLDEKKELLAAMKEYNETKNSRCMHSSNGRSGVVVDRCEDAWCPACINELNMAKRRLLEEMEHDKDRKTAKQQAEDAKKLADIEQALERLQRKRVQDDVQAAIQASEKARQAAHEAMQREVERERERQAAAMREAREQAQREQERQRALAEEQRRRSEEDIRRRKEEMDRQRQEERNMMNKYIGPLGREEDQEAERLKRITELNEFAAEQKRIKDEQLAKEAEEREREKAMTKKMHEQMIAENARIAEENRRLGRQMAKDWADDIKNQREQAERQRKEEIDRERNNAMRMKELDEAMRREEELNRSNVRDTLRRGYDNDIESKRVNQELEHLMSKMDTGSNDAEFREHLTECDRCDILEKPQNLTFLTKDEIEDAGKYIPLKKHRDSANGSLVGSASPGSRLNASK